MAEKVISSLVARALETVAKEAFEKATFWWGARDELKKLKNTITTIQARVLDAERRQEEAESDEVIKVWLQRLRLVLYRADDLFDEVLSLDHKKLLMKGNMLAKVGNLLSKSGPLLYSRKLAKKIESIRIELDGIKDDMGGLNLRQLSAEELLQLPIDRLMKERETGSFVKAEDVVGRENDLIMMIEMLFDPKYDDQKVTVIPIVGFGGLGKTTLAQLVYNDEAVQKHFHLIKWACIPEIGNQRAVMEKVHKSFTGEKSRDLSLDQIETGILTSIKKKKFLLVLDDIWDESRDRWLDLLRLLQCGETGSKVIVTTRSNEVANIVSTISKPYRLRLLTKEESWELFRRLAFRSEQKESNPSLIQIGKEIVDSCGNVPLAIRVVGSLLYSKDREEEWQLIKDQQLSKAKLVEDSKIMHVLKLSYNYLPSALKQCFAYCSLFPKDYEFSRAELVHLWMAQGFFESSNRDIGDQYFLVLLGRNLLQDPEEDNRGNVQTCKMHDLVHDLAQNVARNESFMFGESSTQITNGLVHVNLSEQEVPSTLYVAKRMRSLLGLTSQRKVNLEGVISKFQSLRVLSLEISGVETLPSSIGRLRHLRYLNIAGDSIKCLPNAISKLRNLQTLNLDNCKNLEKLPKDLKKLTNLRNLIIVWDSLTELPSGFGTMTSLQELHRFEVGKVNNTGVDSLPALNLRGDLIIKFHKFHENAVIEAQQATLKDNQRLSFLSLNFQVDGEMDEILRCLQLPQNLRYLEVDGYKGVELPRRWLDGLSKLVAISIAWCEDCKFIPCLIGLRQLKYLYLKGLDALEYIEDENSIRPHRNNVGRLGSAVGPAQIEIGAEYLPFLEVLELMDLPQLKWWTKPSNDDGEQRRLMLPCLLRMKVIGCRKLISMPLAPKLEFLEVRRINGKLLRSNMTLHNDQEVSLSSPSSSLALFTSLQSLQIYQIQEDLESISISNRLQNLNKLELSHCYNLKSLIFEPSNSIQHLHIRWCHSLRNISEGFQHLSALEILEIRCCKEFEDEDEEGNSTGGWQALKSLRSMRLLELPKLKKLPQSIACLEMLQYLTISNLKNLTAIPKEIGNLSMLRELRISNCPKLTSLPPSLQGLTSLQKLCIGGCSDLARRYKKPNGQDCHIIQRIPYVDIEE